MMMMMETNHDQRRQQYKENLLIPATTDDSDVLVLSLEDGSSSPAAATAGGVAPGPALLLLLPSWRHGLAMAFVVGVIWPLYLLVAIVPSSFSPPAAAAAASVVDLYTIRRQRQGLLCGLLSLVGLLVCGTIMAETSPIPRHQEPAAPLLSCVTAAGGNDNDKKNNNNNNNNTKTWFGHHMAPEGSYRNLPIVTCTTFTAIGLMSSITSLSTGCHLLTVPAYYVIGLVLFYVWHVAAHYWTGSDLHKVHMQHHQDYYPPHDFYGDVHPAVRERRRRRGDRAATLVELMIPCAAATAVTRPGQDGPVRLAHEGPLIVALAVLILLSYFVLDVSLGVCVWVLAGYVVMGLFGSAIHMSFHERGFGLEPYAWYRELRALHMIHHLQRQNFAMVNIWLDLVFCSLMVRES